MASFIIRETVGVSPTAPTITPDRSGQILLDETNERVWFSVRNASSADWIEIGAGASLSAAQVKTLYESNANTNAFTDFYKAALDDNTITVSKVSDTDYLATSNDYLIAFTLLTHTRTLSLPTPVPGEKRAFIITDESGRAATYPINITPLTGTINGLSQIEITVQNGGVIVYTDGFNYFTLSEVGASLTGQVKINTGNTVKPQVSITVGNEGTFYPLQYGSPLGLSSYPTTKWPQNIDIPSDGNVYDFINNTFLENTIPGQIHTWRIQMSFSGKQINNVTGVTCRIRNPLSGFELDDFRTIPSEYASGKLVFNFITIADSASLPSPYGSGQGYVMELTADDPIDFQIESVTRISQKSD